MLAEDLRIVQRPFAPNDRSAPEAVGHPDNAPRRGVGVALLLHRRSRRGKSGRRLRAACAELEAHHEDPWRKKVAAAVRDKDAISTAALLDLLHTPATTAAARRVAAIMRSLNFTPIKSRRLMPGGRAGNTVTRGWARPVRAMRSPPTTSNAGAVAPQLGG